MTQGFECEGCYGSLPGIPVFGREPERRAYCSTYCKDWIEAPRDERGCDCQICKPVALLSCPSCGNSRPRPAYGQTDIPCEECGPSDHPGLLCPTRDCFNSYDLVTGRWLFDAPEPGTPASAGESA